MFDILEYIPIINFIWQIIYSITVYLKLIYKLQLLLPLPTESIKILQLGGGGGVMSLLLHWLRACTMSTKLYHTTGFTRDLIVPLVLPNYRVCRRRRLYVYYTRDGVGYYRPLVTSGSDLNRIQWSNLVK